MKNIEIDEELYQLIVTNTQFIGESASSILRRLLSLAQSNAATVEVESTQAVAVKATRQSKAKQTTTSKQIKPKQRKAKQVPAGKVKEKAKTKTSTANKADTVFNHINKEELAMQRGAVGRFLVILGVLHRVHPRIFDAVIDIRGRDRLYFSLSEDDLLANGISTKPMAIPGSPYWVITNSNTTRKKVMLTEVATSLGYKSDDVEKIRELL
jgi:negative modulator of initiation of replication